MRRKGCVLPAAILAAVLLLPVGLAVNAVFIGPVRNDRAAEQLRLELLEEVRLKPGETLIASACFAGNTSGTGDHTELWAGLLTRYDGTVENAPGIPLGDDPVKWWELPGPRNADLRELFPVLQTLDSYTGYYLRERYGEAPTQWDFRGW